MTSPRPLPFDAFLELLRAKGYGVSLHEYNAVAILLERWDRTNVAELGDAIAAVVGRSDEEVQGIARLFRDTYIPAPRVVVQPPPPPDSLAWLRPRLWILALAAALIVAGFVWRNWPARDVAAPPVASVVPPVSTPATQAEAVPLPPPPAPDLPRPPVRIVRPYAIAAVGSGFFLALAGFWILKLRDDRRLWLKSAWTALRATLPGPYHYNEAVHDRPARLPKIDVEDAATLLGRVFSKTGLARELDVIRSLRETLRRGLLPTLVSKPRRIAEAIVVLQDVCQEMGLWEHKVASLLGDLRRQGIALQPYYFDGDLSRISDRPHRPSVPIESVLRHRPDSPILIISSGTGLAAMLEAEERPWLRLLGRRPRTTWLTPVSDVRLWPSALEGLQIDVWPMTRLGLVNAARQLAGADAEAGPIVRARIASEGRVTVEDIERLKRLASVVPHPSPALLDSLRRQFAPDVPDAALLHLMNAGEGPAAAIIRLPDGEVQRNLNALRSETPELEAAARDAVLRVLLDSAPLPGSAAHERWQIAVQMQRLQLADLSRSAPAAAAAMSELRMLAEGALGSEVQDALRLAPASTVTSERVHEVGPERQQVTAKMEERARDAGVGPMRWSWPGLRELVPASVAAALLFLAAFGLNVLPARALDHMREAYGLEYLAQPSVSTPQLNLSLASGDPSLPRTVDLYKENQLFRPGVTLSANAPTPIALTAGDTGAHYQVRATLQEGNLAVSPWVWVTSDQLNFVLVDAVPWANVTITGGQANTAEQQTPFTAALLPGTYQVRFENPTLGPQSVVQQTLTIPAGPTLIVQMPGFDPAQTVDSLLRAPAAAR